MSVMPAMGAMANGDASSTLRMRISRLKLEIRALNPEQLNGATVLIGLDNHGTIWYSFAAMRESPAANSFA